ncbi:MAG: cell envelope integrity protein TolA [Pseudomonadota bacterium]|nr:cell envelope integrity protein TolA [Pseudomonadota bacterium]
MTAALPTPGGPYQVPPEPSRWPSIALAAGVHAALLAFLWIGVSWQNTEPVSVEAEVWDMKTQDAAPPPPPPPPAPEPVQEVAPPPTPEPLPAPKVIPPPPVEVNVTPKPPDIALEREKQRKLQREEERKEREQAERDEEKRQDLADKKAREKADKLAAEKARDKADKLAAEKARDKADKLAAEKKKKEQDAADKLAEKLAEQKDAEKKSLADKKKAADKLAKAKAAADDKVMKDIRDADMRRITGQASGNGTSGTAAKSTAPRLDASYQAAIAGKVKRSTNFAGDTSVPGNPRAEFVVEQLPTGEIISVRKTKSSGVPAFDAAVERGINAASPLPKKKDGTVERSFPIGVAMKDLE